MPSDSDDSEDQAAASHAPRECMACRGSGQVISNLGGTPTQVSCPWCGGGGMRVPGIDAQAGWQGQDGESAPTAPAAEPAA
jgi:DnaJ-class molecular chaperone